MGLGTNMMDSVGPASQHFYGQSSMTGGMNDSLAKTGIERRYQAIQDIKEPAFKRDFGKNEADIVPDKGSTIKIRSKKTKYQEPNPYET